jgi:hypothetical protein
MQSVALPDLNRDAKIDLLMGTDARQSQERHSGLALAKNA